MDVSNSSKSGLLDALREKSEALRAHDSAARKPVEEALKDIDRELWSAFRWLDEALRHLEVIRPKVGHCFRLGSILTIEQPKFDRGFVSFRRRGLAGLEVIDHVEMFYRMEGPEPIILRLAPAAASGVEERLRGSTLQYKYQTENDEKRIVRYGVFRIETGIAASVRFEPDYQRQVVHVTLRNVDRFESVTLEFQPSKLDVSTLEDLVKFMLGEANTFLRRAPIAMLRSRHIEPSPLRSVRA